MPSYFGQAAGRRIERSERHRASTATTKDAAAGLCSNGLSTKPDADQQSSSLFGAGTYPDQPAVDAAKDYAINLIEPVAPAALRGDQLDSIARSGRRRSTTQLQRAHVARTKLRRRGNRHARAVRPD